MSNEYINDDMLITVLNNVNRTGLKTKNIEMLNTMFNIDHSATSRTGLIKDDNNSHIEDGMKRGNAKNISEDDDFGYSTLCDILASSNPRKGSRNPVIHPDKYDRKDKSCPIIDFYDLGKTIGEEDQINENDKSKIEKPERLNPFYYSMVESEEFRGFDPRGMYEIESKEDTMKILKELSRIYNKEFKICLFNIHSIIPQIVYYQMEHSIKKHLLYVFSYVSDHGLTSVALRFDHITEITCGDFIEYVSSQDSGLTFKIHLNVNNDKCYIEITTGSKAIKIDHKLMTIKRNGKDVSKTNSYCIQMVC